MLIEQLKDHVYFSSLLEIEYPELYNELRSILSRHKIPLSKLTYTKDFWCRDYMPIQCGLNLFSQYKYSPDYLHDKPQYQSDTDLIISKMKRFKGSITKSPLVVDGGNIVFCEEDTSIWNHKKYYLIMTDKVMLENPTLSQSQIEGLLKESLGNNELNIIWLPWKHSDMCGHTDGILRYVGMTNGKPTILVNLSLYEKRHAEEMRDILCRYFYVVDLKLSLYDDLSWAYINALQTRDVIIIPGIGNNVTDAEALQQFKTLYHSYGNSIYQVQMRDFIETWGGALNCCSWTTSE